MLFPPGGGGLGGGGRPARPGGGGAGGGGAARAPPEGFALALRLVGKGGTVACNGENRDVTLNVGEHLIRRDITLFGSWFYHFREYPEMLDLVRRGLRADRLITARYPMARAQEAFADFAAGKTAKAIIEP